MAYQLPLAARGSQPRFLPIGGQPEPALTYHIPPESRGPHPGFLRIRQAEPTPRYEVDGDAMHRETNTRGEYNNAGLNTADNVVKHSDEDNKSVTVEDEDEDGVTIDILNLLINHLSSKNFSREYLRKYVDCVFGSCVSESSSEEDEDDGLRKQKHEKLGEPQQMFVNILRQARRGNYHLTPQHLLEIVNNLSF